MQKFEIAVPEGIEVSNEIQAVSHAAYLALVAAFEKHGSPTLDSCVAYEEPGAIAVIADAHREFIFPFQETKLSEDTSVTWSTGFRQVGFRFEPTDRAAVQAKLEIFYDNRILPILQVNDMLDGTSVVPLEVVAVIQKTFESLPGQATFDA